VREAARARLLAEGLDEAAIDALWADFPDDSFLRYRPEQIAWQTHGIVEVGRDGLPVVLVRPHARVGAMEVFVYSPDRDGLFASAATTLDRLGLSIVDARILTSIGGMTLDTFQVLEAETAFDGMAAPQRAAAVAQALRESLRTPGPGRPPPRRALPRQLRHFRVPVQIEFAEKDDRTQLTLVCNDRSGLLAQVAAILHAHHIRVHDARIATFGERVEDFFELSDAGNRPLAAAQCRALEAALRECVELA
jgi:[protein-PII] uridylyltransferase